MPLPSERTGTIFLDQRSDGSIALFLSGNLQFDSRDEAIYHEALALVPAALAQRRFLRPLRALVCGGGDGLVARELLKFAHLTLDLVEIDPAILELARGELATINGCSLSSPRVTIHQADAWDFLASCQPATYHLIISDLTVPQDRAGARFHSVDFFARLKPLLEAGGVVAVNAFSPCLTPKAYWSSYNAMRAAGLAPRPYRVPIPSFAQQGYGPDWGFLVGSNRAIEATELDHGLGLAGKGKALVSPSQVRRLFYFPGAIAQMRTEAPPTRQGSDALLQFAASVDLGATSTGMGAGEWDALAFATDSAPLLPALTGTHLLPPGVAQDLAATAGGSGDRQQSEPRFDTQSLLAKVLGLLPTFDPSVAQQMVTALLEDPARLLAGIDLPGLVKRLLQRAAELPARIAEELEHLARRLSERNWNAQELLDLGLRAISVVAVVVLLANLLHPDAVFGKGSHFGWAGHSLSRPTSVIHINEPPSVARLGGFGRRSARTAVDEEGATFPARSYSLRRDDPDWANLLLQLPGPTGPDSGPVANVTGCYRLTPDVDLLPDGSIAASLIPDAYLLLSSGKLSVIDDTTGRAVMQLRPEATFLTGVATELERQTKGLDQSLAAKQSWIAWFDWLSLAPWGPQDQRELSGMQQMRDLLAGARSSVGQIMPPANLPLEIRGLFAEHQTRDQIGVMGELWPGDRPPGSTELFAGVWALNSGRGLALLQEDGSWIYLDEADWYRDHHFSTRLEQAYPQEFVAVLLRVLANHCENANARHSALQAEVAEARRDLDPTSADPYQGQLQQQIAQMEQQLVALPGETALMQSLYHRFLLAKTSQ